MSVRATLSYAERRVAGGDQVSGGDRVLAVRHYDDAQATIKSEEGGGTPELPDGQRLLVVHGSESGRLTIASPAGPRGRQHVEPVDLAWHSGAIN